MCRRTGASETPIEPHSRTRPGCPTRSPMRPSLPIVAAALLAAVLAAPAAALTPGGAAEETVTGVLEAIQVESRDGTDPLIYSVRQGHRVTPVAFESGDASALAGATVSVRGVHRDGRLEVRSARPGRDAQVRARPHAQPDALGSWSAETSGSELASAASGTTASVGATATPVATSVAVVMFNFSDLRTT